MKALRKGMFLFLLLSAAKISAADPDPMASNTGQKDLVMRVKLTQPIVTGNSADAQSAPEGLTGPAISMGLGDATLHGSVSHEKLPDTSTRETINWHSVSAPAGNTRASEALTSPLTSQFSVKDNRVEPGTVLNVRGDLDGLAQAIDRLKKKTPTEPKHLVSNTDKETNNQVQGAGSLSPNSGGRTMGGNMPLPLSTSNNKMATNLITSSWESCPPRIDQGGWKVYEQFKKVERGSDGNTVSVGACIDQGAVVDIVKNYASCSIVADQNARKAFQQYKTFATLNGQKLDVADCKMDTEAFYPVESTPVGCSVRHDFVAKKSIQQQKLFYKDSLGATVPVADCQDSDLAYAQYTTANTCVPTWDQGQNIMIGNSRVAYKDAAGTEQYAAECRPDDSRFAVLEAYCDPKYDHDFGAGQSYYLTRSYYVNGESKPAYLTACARSTKTSFPHIYQTATCGVVNDDAKLLTTWKSKTQIQTETDGVLEIAPCQVRGSPTPYAFLGEDKTVWREWIELGWMSAIVGQATYFDTLKANFVSMNFTNSLNNYTVLCYGPGTGGTMAQCGGTNPDFNNYILEKGGWMVKHKAAEEFRKKYLRGDGTSYADPTIAHNNLGMRMCISGTGNGYGRPDTSNCPAPY